MGRKQKRQSRRPSSLQEKVNILKSKIDYLEKSIKPILLEREAIEESHSKILVSCDASVNGDRSSTGVVIRLNPKKEPYTFSKRTNSTNSNEAELDAIYNGLCTFESLFANSSHDMHPVEIRTDSKYCIDLLRKKKIVDNLKNKVDIILEKVKYLNNIWDNNITFVWKRRNSTHDLAWADSLSKGE